jgi:hypothetical protein
MGTTVRAMNSSGPDLPLVEYFVVIPDSLRTGPARKGGGAGEYAVFKKLPSCSFLQVESIGFCWCTPEKPSATSVAHKYGRVDYAAPTQPHLETLAKHGSCPLCA